MATVAPQKLVRIPLVERAFELAGSGQVPNVDQLVKTLKHEGYEQVEAHVAGSPSLRRQLHEVCRNAWAATGKQPVNGRWRA